MNYFADKGKLHFLLLKYDSSHLHLQQSVMRNHHKLIWWKITGVHRLVLVDVTRMFKLIIVLLFFILLYLCEADVSADVFRQVDHVSLLGQHHDESSQRLRVESVHWIFLFFLFRLLSPILNCCKKKRPGDYYSRQNLFHSMSLFVACLFFLNLCYSWSNPISSDEDICCHIFRLCKEFTPSIKNCIDRWVLSFSCPSVNQFPGMNEYSCQQNQTSKSWCISFVAWVIKILLPLLLMSSLLCSPTWGNKILSQLITQHWTCKELHFQSSSLWCLHWFHYWNSISHVGEMRMRGERGMSRTEITHTRSVSARWSLCSAIRLW